jgi:hypothetical protein
MLFGRPVRSGRPGEARQGNGQEFRNKNLDGTPGEGRTASRGKWAVDVLRREDGFELKRVREGDPMTPGAERKVCVPGDKFGGNVSVPVGYVGVAIYRGGSVYADPLGPGYHLMPLVKKTKLLSVQQQYGSTSGKMVSADGVHVDVSMSIFYRMLPEFGTMVHESFPDGYKGAVETLLWDVAKSVIEGNQAESIYREQQRVRDEIHGHMDRVLRGSGFLVEGVLVRNIGLPVSFEESIRKRAEIAPLTEQNKAQNEFKILDMRLQQAFDMAQVTANTEVGVQQVELELMILRLEETKKLLVAQADRLVAIEKAGTEADSQRIRWTVEADVKRDQIDIRAQELALTGKAEAEVAQEKGEAEMEVRRVKGEVEAETIGKKMGAVIGGLLHLGKNGKG